ncbi:MAG: magnesium transporter CorA family protein [Proteobacteria bacterium]|nr:magnesium transporter CorA family protein [Pseudomonadota bacterium]
MIIAYCVVKNKLERLELKPEGKLPEGLIWIDLIEPSAKEERFVETALGINAPTREEMDKNEVMSPFYQEGEASYMTITALYNQGSGHPESTAITLILLENKCLVTMRYHRPKAFSHFVARAVRFPDLCQGPEKIMEGLMEALVNSIADVLEKAGNELDRLLKELFEKPALEGDLRKSNNSSQYYDQIIKHIGRMGNLLSKNRESLVSINRMLIFYSQLEYAKNIKRDNKSRFRVIAQEVHSLSEYVSFLSQRNSFLLDATLGMIGVEQNMIIKVFTVAAAALMPPTLIASIYGMNFHNMPEINAEWGYPIALLAIVVSAILPYYFFKKKGWL